VRQSLPAKEAAGEIPGPPMLRLQDAVGNRGVLRRMQAKMKVSQPGDPLELEADRIADQVMSAQPVATIQRKCATCAADGGTCPKCEEEQELYRQETRGNSSPPRTAGIDSQIASLRGGGQPMSAPVRSFYESRLGADFSQVRIHTGNSAAETAQAIQARAFTVGTDVVFGPGEYSPHTGEGARLLAHELVHVVQQSEMILRQDSAAGMTSAIAPASIAVPQPVQTDCSQPNKPVELLPGTPIFSYGELTIARSNAYMRNQLETFFAKHGRVKTQEAIIALISTVSDEIKILAALSGMDAETFHACQEIIRVEFDAMCSDADSFKIKFTTYATNLTMDLLNRSEKITQDELTRYGIEFSNFCSLAGCHPSMIVSQTDTLQQLPEAARILSKKRRERNLAFNRFSVVKKKMMEEPLIPSFQVYDEHLETAVNHAQQEWLAQEDEYNAVRKESEARFPILGLYSSKDDGAASLDVLASMSQNSLAETIGFEARKVLAKIAYVRNALGKEFSVWKQPHIVATTKELLSTTPYLGRAIDDTVDAVTEAEANTKTLFLLVSFGLGLVSAIPTGGSSLIAAAINTSRVVAAGLVIYSSYDQLKEFELESAMFGMAYDRANAISRDDPSLAWLAVDIVSNAIDAGATAVSTFRALAKARRVFNEFRILIKSAESGNVVAAEHLFERSTHLSAESTVRLQRQIANAFPTKDLETAVEIATTASGMVKVTPSGKLFLCNSPCAELRARFALVLKRDAQLNSRLADLEGQVAKNGQRKVKGFKSSIADLTFQLKVADSEMRASQIMKSMPALIEEFPILKTQPLTKEAMVRVLMKSTTNLNKIKGQVLEELLAVWAEARSQQELAVLAGRSGAEAAAQAGSPIEFIAGHRIKDASGRVGRELTDGILAFKDKNGRYHILKIFEVKSGQFSAESLAKPMDLMQLRSAAPREYFGLQAGAVRELKASDPRLADLKTKEITMDNKYTERLEAIMRRKQLESFDYGQARRTTERFGVNDGEDFLSIRIDGELVDTSGARPSTGIIGVVPSDTFTGEIKDVLQSERIRFAAMKMDVTQSELIDIADRIGVIAAGIE
jgi:hypothetical protein